MESGFLKLAQKFRSNVENGKYLPIVDSLYEISRKHQNNLPHSFSLDNLYSFSKEDIEYVLLKLYPYRNYTCKLINETFFCIM